MKPYIKRKVLSHLESYRNERQVFVITGFRRVGKTSLVMYLYDTTKSANKLFLDLENPLNQQIFTEKNYDAIWQFFTSRGINPRERSYIFLDEIQYVKELPSVVKYLYDHYDATFYLTGSSSFYLKNHFSESLSGRKWIFELYPLDFDEFLWFKDSRLRLNDDYDLFHGLYEEYMQFGGFPGVVLQTSADKKEIELDSILGSYFQLDVRTLAPFRDIANLQKLMLLLAERIGSKADITKLATSLDVSRQTVYTYLDFLEQTYLIHSVPLYSTSIDVMVRHVPKIYFCDSGLANRLTQLSLGQVFEQTICTQLIKRASLANPSGIVPPVSYYHHKTKGEIDFIFRKETAYEVKARATSHDVRRLARLAEGLDIGHYSVLTVEKMKQNDSHMIYPYQL